MQTEVRNKYSLPREGEMIGGWDDDVIVHLFYVDNKGTPMAIVEVVETGQVRNVLATWVKMKKGKNEQ